MRRWLRGCLLALLAIVALAGAAQVGFVPARTLTIETEEGAPAGEALAIYHYRGERWNLVDSISYRRSGGWIRTAGDGRLRTPARFHWKGVFDGYARPELKLLYLPALHFARADPALERQVGDRLEVRDLRDDPAAWEQSIEALHAMCFTLRSLGKLPDASFAADAVALEPELAAAVRREYGELLARHRGTPRQAPQGDARLPTWGDYLPGKWSSRLEQLDRP